MGVSINLDVSALTMLFETLDEETVLHIKQAVVEETCRRTIHAIVPQEMTNLMQRVIREELAKQVGYYDYKASKLHLERDVEKQINQRIKELVASEVSRILNADNVFEEIQQQVDSTLIDLRGNIFLTIVSKINQQISKYIDQEVDRRLKEVLGEKK